MLFAVTPMPWTSCASIVFLTHVIFNCWNTGRAFPDLSFFTDLETIFTGMNNFPKTTVTWYRIHRLCCIGAKLLTLAQFAIRQVHFFKSRVCCRQPTLAVIYFLQEAVNKEWFFIGDMVMLFFLLFFGGAASSIRDWHSVSALALSLTRVHAAGWAS